MQAFATCHEAAVYWQQWVLMVTSFLWTIAVGLKLSDSSSATTIPQEQVLVAHKKSMMSFSLNPHHHIYLTKSQ